MKAGISVALFCGTCHMALEHVGSEFVRCVNRPCDKYGVKWATPTIELAPYEEPTKEGASAQS
jgi:hypothetical protein